MKLHTFLRAAGQTVALFALSAVLGGHWNLALTGIMGAHWN